jgi:hypothetical protein
MVQGDVIDIARYPRRPIFNCARNVSKPQATPRGRPSLARHRITPASIAIRANDQRVVLAATG